MMKKKNIDVDKGKVKREECKRKEKNGKMRRGQKVIEIWRRKKRQEYVLEEEEERVRTREDKKEREGRVKIAFWNVAGLRNKDREFWERIKQWDVMVFIETWIDEKH